MALLKFVGWCPMWVSTARLAVVGDNGIYYSDQKTLEGPRKPRGAGITRSRLDNHFASHCNLIIVFDIAC